MSQQTATVAFYAYLDGAWVLLDDIRPAIGNWGFGDNDPLSRLADTGQFSLALNNSGGIYSPDGVSALAGWRNGVPFKLVVTYDGSDTIRYVGNIIIDSIKPRKQVSIDITVLDWLDYAARYQIPNPVLLENVTSDDAFNEIISNMAVAPLATQFDVGNSTYPTVFDTVKDFTTGYVEAGKLVLSEPSYFYLRHDGAYGETAVFENSSARNGLRTLKEIPASGSSGFLKKQDDGYLLQESGGKLILGSTESVVFDTDDPDTSPMSYRMDYGENIINRIVTSAYPRKIDTTTVKVYELERPLAIAAGETQVFKVKYTNPQGGNPINALSPTQDATTKSLIHFEGERSKYSVDDETGIIWTLHSFETVTNIVKIGKAAGYFDGGASYLSASKGIDLGTSDFTIEWWEYRFNVASGRCVTSSDYSSSFPGFKLGHSNGTNSLVYLSSDGASFDIANGKSFGAPTIGVWEHYSLVRQGTTFTMRKQGTTVQTFFSADPIYFDESAIWTIGREGSAYITAVIDEFRVKVGEAVYTTDFTPSLEPFFLEGTYGSLWTNEDGTGADLSDDLSISTEYFTNGALHSVTNNSASSGWITSLKTFAFGIYTNSSIDDTQESLQSIVTDLHGQHSASLQMAYQQSLYAGVLEAAKILDAEKQPRTKLNELTFCANKSAELMQAFLNIDVGDLVSIKIPDEGIDGYYYVQGVKVNIEGLIWFTWIVKEAYTLDKGLTPLELTFGGEGTEDAVSFGYLPLVSGDDVTKRIFSAWVNFADTANPQAILSSDSAPSGISLFITDTGAVQFYSKRNYDGNWTTISTISPDTLTHILVYNDLTATDPVIYIDGVDETLTGSGTPLVPPTSEVGNNFMIGNINYAAYFYPADGAILDVRVYTGDIDHATLAAALTAEGAYGTDNTTGMVFGGMYCRTKDAAAYDSNAVLTEDTKVLDGYLGYVGTPHGGVITNYA